ncbi:unnamed protein product [Larinioides sclopetarius]|uniref:Uncharacterized protein n=1 Tax=Larinioides sclopetarius TaxID=280406 RepID=A0AAV2A4T3_9ARAC
MWLSGENAETPAQIRLKMDDSFIDVAINVERSDEGQQRCFIWMGDVIFAIEGQFLAVNTTKWRYCVLVIGYIA